MNEILERIDALGPVLAAHAGGIELVDVSEGVVRLRYTGMCAGCHLRPVTTASAVRPALLAVEGVTAIEIEGSRVSPEAEARLVAAFESASTRLVARLSVSPTTVTGDDTHPVPARQREPLAGDW